MEIFYSGGTELERGVAISIILEKDMAKTVKGYWTLSDLLSLLKIAGKLLDLNIIQIYW